PGARAETDIQAHQKQVDVLLDIYRQPRCHAKGGDGAKGSKGSESHGAGPEVGIIIFGEDRPVGGKAPLDSNAGRPTAPGGTRVEQRRVAEGTLYGVILTDPGAAPLGIDQPSGHRDKTNPPRQCRDPM